MSTISTQVRTFKEPTKDQLLYAFFSIPDIPISSSCGHGSKKPGSSGEIDTMEISAVLTLGEREVEDAYVSFLSSHSHYLCIISVI